jgi:transcriptional regulator with XRE-family HTH domain
MPDPDPIRAQLGALIKERRRAMGYSSAQALAEAAGVSRRSVAGAERGAYTSRRVLGPIERVLGWPPHGTDKFLQGHIEELATAPLDTADSTTGRDEDVPDLDPGSRAWLQDMHGRLPAVRFHEMLDLLFERTKAHEGADSERPPRVG